MLPSSPTSRRIRGQTLVEFALVVPVMLAIVGGIIQFGLLFWAQNTLTQVVRDTGRWAATQQAVCWPSGSWGPAQDAVRAQANLVAANSSLLGYTTGQWGSVATYPASPQPAEGVEVAWFQDSDPGTKGCPPKDNQHTYHITIRISHVIPVFFPGLQYLPGLGTCDSTGCHISLSSTAQYRMEPKP